MTLDRPPDPVAAGAAPPRWFGRLAKLTAVLTYAGVVTGGVVTSTESGRVDTGWPLFSGRWLPSFTEMAANAGLLVEHGHRMVMGTVGFLALLIAVLAWCGFEPRRGVRWLATATGCLVLPPAILGGLTVLGRLHPALSILHVGFAMLFLSAAVALATITSRRWFEPVEPLAREKVEGLAGLALATAIVTYVQVVLGAVPRHATAEVGGALMLAVGNGIHIVWAFAVFTMAVMLSGRIIGRLSRADRLLRPGAALLVLLLVQVFLGFGAFVTQPKDPAPVVDAHHGFVASGGHELVASLHQAAGVLILAVTVVLVLRAFRYARASRDASALGMGGAPDGSEVPA